MIYVLLLILSFVLTYLIKNYATKKSLLVEIDERSSHEVPTPHGGGIAVAIVWFSGLTYLYFSNEIEPTLYYALLLGVIIAVVGFVDDIVEISPSIRMIIYASVSIFGLYILGGLQTITLGFINISNPFITTLFALFMLVWYINLTNFVDGIDAYLGMMFLYLSVAGLILYGDSYFIILGVSVLGFLYWNWHKAKIFMGDSGSTLLGYTIAIITLHDANSEPINLWIWITLYMIFWFDATITLIRRKCNGEYLSRAHRKHAYQRLTQYGWSHSRVTLYALGINVIIFLLVYYIQNIFISFTLSLLLVYGSLKYVDSKIKFE